MVQWTVGTDCDSKSVMFLESIVYGSKTTHMYVEYHFVRYIIEENKVLLVKVDTLKNIVDS